MDCVIFLEDISTFKISFTLIIYTKCYINLKLFCMSLP